MNLFQCCKEYENEYNHYQQVSMEMIDEQNNDYIVKALRDQFLSLIELGYKSNESFFTESDSKKIINNIDNFIFERFGIRVKTISARGIPYACIPIAPNHTNVLKRNMESETELIERDLKNYEFYKPIDGDKLAEDAHWDINHIYKRLVTGRKSLAEYLKSNDIYIDLKKAKISNLPSDYLVYILADFHMLFNIYKLNEFEITAVLLHEIGHIFTHLEYSHRVAYTTQVLVDTVRDVVLKQNNSTKENLRLIYEKATETKVSPEYKNMKTITAAIYVGKGLLNRVTSVQDHSYTDSEQLADQFSAKFGMGGYLVTALDKLHSIDSIKPFIRSTWYLSQGCIYISIIFLAIMACFNVTFVAIYTVVYFSLYAAMMGWLVLTRKSSASEEEFLSGMTYDDIKRRYTRNKNELVRQLALAKLPKDVEKEIVNNIKTIENSIAKVPDAHTSIIDKFFLLFSDDKKFIVNSKRTEQVLEDIMSNDVHIGRALLQDLI